MQGGHGSDRRSFQTGVGRPIHLPHATGAGGDFIGAEARAGSEVHV